MPVVSVVIPAYNRAAFLGEAIESVRRQTFQDWELVIVDDGSTDHTPQVATRCLGDPRIRCVVQPHQERSAARNRGIEATAGRYIALLDADDCWKPEKLERQVAVMEAHPAAALCYTLIRWVDRAGAVVHSGRHVRPPGGRILRQLLVYDCIGTSSVLIRRRCLQRVGLFDASLPAYGREDWDLWLRLARWYDILPIEEELTVHRVYEGNSSLQENFQSGLTVLERRCRDPGFLAEAGMPRAAAYAYLHLASAAAPSAEIPRATRAKRLAWALAHYPPSLFSRPALAGLARVLLPRWAAHAVRRWYRTRLPLAVQAAEGGAE